VKVSTCHWLHEGESQGGGNEFTESSVQECRRPGGNGNREGSLHKGATDQRGVHDIITESTEQRLAQTHRYNSGDGRHPQRETGGQCQAEQQSGNDDTPVIHRTGPAGQAAEQGLAEHAGQCRHRQQRQHADAERVYRKGAHRQQRINHIAHDLFDSHRLFQVWRGA
jgi:hypothetical protein